VIVGWDEGGGFDRFNSLKEAKNKVENYIKTERERLKNVPDENVPDEIVKEYH
jgi:hypothetical protein